MEKYKILPHKADLQIRSFGETKEELFSNMLKGVTSVLKGRNKKHRRERSLYVKSSSLETLLVDFLNEIIYLCQVNKEIYTSFIFEKLNNKSIKGRLKGWKVMMFGEDIKAATYHGLRIRKKEDGIWEATVLFDI